MNLWCSLFVFNLEIHLPYLQTSQPVKEVPSEAIEYIQDYLSKAHRGIDILSSCLKEKTK